MTEENTYVRPDGARICRKCDRSASRRYKREGPTAERCEHPPGDRDSSGHCRQCERDRQRERRSTAEVEEIARPRPTRCPDCGAPALEVRVPERSGRRKVLAPVLVEPDEVECPRVRCPWCTKGRPQGTDCARCGAPWGTRGWSGEPTPKERTVAVGEDGSAHRVGAPGLGGPGKSRRVGDSLHRYHRCAAAAA